VKSSPIDRGENSGEGDLDNILVTATEMSPAHRGGQKPSRDV
jgi:hypothetical protein